MSAPKQLLVAVVSLVTLAALGSAMVAVTWSLSHEKIAANQARALRQQLQQLQPPSRYDNLLEQDALVLDDDTSNARMLTFYRARWNRKPAGGVMHVRARNGYNGTLDLLVGVRNDGTLTGVRVVRHRETPGLGDAIELDRSHWIRQFDERSLTSPAAGAWRVSRDGGDFDQLTGATVTSRAVTAGVRDALLYFDAHRHRLFAAPITDRSETR